MASPLINGPKIVEWLKAKKLGVEVFSEFPSDMKNVRHGIYVNDPATTDRTPYALAIHYGSNIYTVTDDIRIILVSFQGDDKRDKSADAITSMVQDNVLLDGYHERDFTMNEDFMNRAEYRTYDFTLKRIELQ